MALGVVFEIRILVWVAHLLEHDYRGDLLTNGSHTWHAVATSLPKLSPEGCPALCASSDKALGTHIPPALS